MVQPKQYGGSKLYFLLISFLLSLTCCCNKLENKITENWYIIQLDSFFEIKTSGISFYKDHTCNLPLTSDHSFDSRNEQGTWVLYKREGKNFIDIKTSNKVFNREFEIIAIEIVYNKERDAHAMDMILVSDSLALKCRRAMYY
ncbi:MAG: hypothetical protein R6W78_19175 [Bacteroidales bacterium]